MFQLRLFLGAEHLRLLDTILRGRQVVAPEEVEVVKSLRWVVAGETTAAGLGDC